MDEGVQESMACDLVRFYGAHCFDDCHQSMWETFSLYLFLGEIVNARERENLSVAPL